MRVSRHKQFQSALASGVAYQHHLTKQLRKSGVDCFVPDDTPGLNNVGDYRSLSWVIRESKVFADDIDIQCNNGASIEVKSRHFYFSGPEDYPYPTIRLETKESRDRRQGPQPAIIMSISTKGGGVVGVLGSTSHMWAAEKFYDTFRHYTATWLVADTSLLLNYDQCVDFLKNYKI